MNKNVAMFGFLVFMAFIVISVAYLRDFGNPQHREMDDSFIQHGQEETATNNIVTTVVFDYRGFDTLGEATVLFSAVTGVVAVFRRLIK